MLRKTIFDRLTTLLLGLQYTQYIYILPLKQNFEKLDILRFSRPKKNPGAVTASQAQGYYQIQ